MLEPNISLVEREGPPCPPPVLAAGRGPDGVRYTSIVGIRPVDSEALGETWRAHIPWPSQSGLGTPFSFCGDLWPLGGPGQSLCVSCSCLHQRQTFPEGRVCVSAIPGGLCDSCLRMVDQYQGPRSLRSSVSGALVGRWTFETFRHLGGSLSAAERTLK